jgi:hypothetical protein
LAKETLAAVHDEDLEELLRGLDVLHDFTAGKMRCKFCDDVITEANLNAIFPDSGAVKVSCDRPPCVIGLATRVAEARMTTRA